MSKYIFIVTVTEIDGPERKVLLQSAFNSLTNAKVELKAEFLNQKRLWLSRNEWRDEKEFEDFSHFASEEGHISYGWNDPSIDFKITKLKIQDA